VKEREASRSLGAEVALLDRSRHALEEGQLALAQQYLTQYDREFQNPKLAQEANILRAQLLERNARPKTKATNEPPSK
jgi:hypothetical protein